MKATGSGYSFAHIILLKQIIQENLILPQPPTLRGDAYALTQLQRFVSIHDPIANLFHLPRNTLSSAEHRDLRNAAMQIWREIACVAAA